MVKDVDWDRQELIDYYPGKRVELKQHPGVIDIIVAYDRMMVPPIWLKNDPQPRYPEELILLSLSTEQIGMHPPKTGKLCPQHVECARVWGGSEAIAYSRTRLLKSGFCQEIDQSMGIFSKGNPVRGPSYSLDCPLLVKC